MGVSAIMSKVTISQCAEQSKGFGLHPSLEEFNVDGKNIMVVSNSPFSGMRTCLVTIFKALKQDWQVIGTARLESCGFDSRKLVESLVK